MFIRPLIGSFYALIVKNEKYRVLKIERSMHTSVQTTMTDVEQKRERMTKEKERRKGQQTTFVTDRDVNGGGQVFFSLSLTLSFSRRRRI